MAAKIKNQRTMAHYKHKPKGVSTRDFEKVHWPYLPILFVIFFILTFMVQSNSLNAITKHPGSKVLAYSTSMSVSGLLADTNTQRINNGVGSLSLNSKLNAAAQAKANDMASRNYWSHNTPEGNPPWIFVNSQGYSYQKLGENLAAGFSSEQDTINGWMASPPHKENLLDPAFVDVGFGYANNANYTSAGGGPMTIVVAFYGKPASAPAPVAKHTAPVTPPHAPISTPAPAPVAKHTAPITTQTSKQKATPATGKPASKTNSESSIQKDKSNENAPVNTDNAPSGVTLSLRTSNAQLAFAKLPISSFATGLATFSVFASAGFWISRHLLTLRRVFVHGESFVIKHPLIDVGLIVIAALSYVLSQTAGFIL
jgi:uncharacterized protein YkwD